MNTKDEEMAQRRWELSKYSLPELLAEINRRNPNEMASEMLYAKKDTIDFDEQTGEPFDTEEI